jgi:hypothetical protein
MLECALNKRGGGGEVKWTASLEGCCYVSTILNFRFHKKWGDKVTEQQSASESPSSMEFNPLKTKRICFI